MRFLIGLGILAMNSAATLAAPAKTDDLAKLTRQVGHKFGKCVVRHHAGGASKAILRNADMRTLRTHYSALFDSSCFSSNFGMIFPGDTFRYVLADALVAREFEKAPVPRLTDVPLLDHIAPPAPPAAPPANASEVDAIRYQLALKSIEQTRLARLLSLYGECIVRADTAGARNLLMSEPESADEGKSFEALHPAFQSCLSEGQTVNLTKTALRGTIALNYYRLAKTALHVPVR